MIYIYDMLKKFLRNLGETKRKHRKETIVTFLKRYYSTKGTIRSMIARNF